MKRSSSRQEQYNIMNNLAVVEGNEEKLVEAGAVQHYEQPRRGGG